MNIAEKTDDIVIVMGLELRDRALKERGIKKQEITTTKTEQTSQ